MIIVLLYSMLMLELEDVGWSLGTHTVIQWFQIQADPQTHLAGI